MRIILTSTLALVLAGCAATPKPEPGPAPGPARPVAPAPAREYGPLIGLDANALSQRFGLPRLQVREGNGTKLQYAGGSCLLDAYLYPAPGRSPRVTHVDTRNREGRNVDQANCITMIETR